MTPSARVQAAIEVLDHYLGGTALEKALTNWGRRSRYAGSKDRAAVRDIVFQCVRCQLSYAAIGGSRSGRGLVIGYVASTECVGSEVFDGSQFGPAALTEEDRKRIDNRELPDELHVRLDAPDWVLPSLCRAHGDALEAVMACLQNRAPVFVRVNLSKTTRAAAIDLLAEDGIGVQPHNDVKTALEVIENPRRIGGSEAYRLGLIELQDLASQAVCLTVPTDSTTRVLDYCAGGGGKALALADRAHDQMFAHDADWTRMSDLPDRARRAGVSVSCLRTADLTKHAPYDVVFCDVPCSGTGAWRRAPESKWTLTQERLDHLREVQLTILKAAADLVGSDGLLVYATCSMLCEENEDQIRRFLDENQSWKSPFSKVFSPLEGGDGFFVSHLTR